MSFLPFCEPCRGGHNFDGTSKIVFDINLCACRQRVFSPAPTIPSPSASPLRTCLRRRCLLGLLPRSSALSSGRDGTVEGWPDAAREINSLRRRAFLGHLKLDLADAV